MTREPPPDDETRLILHRRFSYCLWCGRGLDPSRAHAHHRLMRSHGGDWGLSNIVLLHGPCHNVAGQSVHQNPAKAYARGLLIRTGLLTPLDTPVYSELSRSYFTLDQEGRAHHILEAAALEILNTQRRHL